jgi:hypothetical protein
VCGRVACVDDVPDEFFHQALECDDPVRAAVLGCRRVPATDAVPGYTLVAAAVLTAAAVSFPRTPKMLP